MDFLVKSAQVFIRNHENLHPSCQSRLHPNVGIFKDQVHFRSRRREPLGTGHEYVWDWLAALHLMIISQNDVVKQSKKVLCLLVFISKDWDPELVARPKGTLCFFRCCMSFSAPAPVPPGPQGQERRSCCCTQSVLVSSGLGYTRAGPMLSGICKASRGKD